MHLKTPDNRSHTQRFPLIDTVRGLAIVLMIIYHLCYDLDVFGYIDTVFGVGYWIPFRYIIVILFLLLVGISLQFVHSHHINWQSVKKRIVMLGFACIAVTASSFFIAPDKITVFGILQLILFSSLLGLIFIDKGRAALLSGTIVFILGHVISTPVMESATLHWLGMVETKRPALDYAPVFPWFGVVLWGISIGVLIKDNDKLKTFLMTKDLVKGRLKVALNWAGKHSLIIYLVHQPILFGLFTLID